MKKWFSLKFFIKNTGFNEKIHFCIEKCKGTLILNEKINRNFDFQWKTFEKLRFCFKIREKAWIFGLFALRAEKAGPDNWKSYKMRPRRGTAGGKNAKRRSLLAKYVESKSLKKDDGRCTWKLFYSQKSDLCLARQTWKIPEIWSPLQWKQRFLKILGAPEGGPKGGSRRLGRRQERLTREPSSQANLNKENKDF